MNIYKACVVSPRHAEKNIPCQDFCAVMPTYDNYTIGALSDGAGSAKFADLASFTTVNAFLNYMRKYTSRYSLDELLTLEDKEIGEDVVMYCRRAIENLSVRIGFNTSDLREFCATFLGFVISDKEIVMLHLGDGEAYGLTKEGKIHCLSAADNINGISTHTHFTVDSDAVDFMRVSRFPKNDFKAVLIMSDGVKPVSENIEEHIASQVFTEWQTGKLTSDTCLCRLIDNEETKKHNDDHSMVFVEL